MSNSNLLVLNLRNFIVVQPKINALTQFYQRIDESTKMMQELKIKTDEEESA
jgi:membrane protein insertase Oxa1/YidC/SpoIIIJ